MKVGVIHELTLHKNKVLSLILRKSYLYRTQVSTVITLDKDVTKT